MAHLPHRTMKINPKPTVAELAPVPVASGIERHLGTTRVPRSRVLKPPIG